MSGVVKDKSQGFGSPVGWWLRAKGLKTVFEKGRVGCGLYKKGN